MRLLILIFILSTAIMSACTSTFSPFPKTEEHIVGSGDTVYSIAFENDLDYRSLARWNDIQPPYRIYKGQMLVLHGYHPLAKNGENSESSTKSKQPRESKTKTQPIKQNSSGPVREVKTEPLETASAGNVAINPIVPPQTKKSATPPTPVVAKAEEVKPVSSPAAQPATQKWSIPEYNDPWIWPVRGKVIDQFSSTNKGIDIAGNIGDPVRATAAGKVVYAGEGLKGYGLLLIVKHDQNYLSAYGHNDRLLVVQGEQVKQGQPIATLGRGPENRSMLHFELRRNGKPVNPVKMLPK